MIEKDIPPIEVLVRQGFVNSLKSYFRVQDCVVVRATDAAGAIRQYLMMKAQSKGQIQQKVKVEYPIIILRPTAVAVNRQTYPANRLARRGVHQGYTETDESEMLRRYSMVPVVFQYELLYLDNDEHRLDFFANRVIMGSVKRGPLHFTVVYDSINASVVVNFDESLTQPEITNGPDEVNQIVQQTSVQVEGFMSDYGPHIAKSYTLNPRHQVVVDDPK